MGLLDGVLGQLAGGLLGGGQQGQAGANPQAALIQAALGMLTNQGGAQAGATGGAGDLIGKLMQSGLGPQVQSWLSNGQNLPVTGDQVQQALGGAHLEQLAAAAGLSHGDAASGLAAILPGLIDKLSPNGQVAAPAGGAGDLASLLGGLLGGNKQA